MVYTNPLALTLELPGIDIFLDRLSPTPGKEGPSAKPPVPAPLSGAVPTATLSSNPTEAGQGVRAVIGYNWCAEPFADSMLQTRSNHRHAWLSPWEKHTILAGSTRYPGCLVLTSASQGASVPWLGLGLCPFSGSIRHDPPPTQQAGHGGKAGHFAFQGAVSATASTPMTHSTGPRCACISLRVDKTHPTESKKTRDRQTQDPPYRI